VAAYGQILPKEILEIPKHGCLNVHPSLLPKYRGPTPVQTAILNGDEETGVTVIKMTEKIDAGDIVASTKYEVRSTKIFYKDLEKALAELGAKLLIETIPKWIKGEIKPKPQDESKATYTKILKKEDGHINWSKSAEEIERQIRALNPEPGVFTEYSEKILKILESEVLENDIKKQIGEVFLIKDRKLVVQTGKDCLIIKKLQLEGGKSLEAQDFLRGHQEIIGTILQ
jgi:methionyl-tRNA formyltransferase